MEEIHFQNVRSSSSATFETSRSSLSADFIGTSFLLTEWSVFVDGVSRGLFEFEETSSSLLERSQEVLEILELTGERVLQGIGTENLLQSVIILIVPRGTFSNATLIQLASTVDNLHISCVFYAFLNSTMEDMPGARFTRILRRGDNVFENSIIITGIVREVLEIHASTAGRQRRTLTSPKDERDISASFQSLKALVHLVLTGLGVGCLNLGLGFSSLLLINLLKAWRNRKFNLDQLEMRKRVVNERSKKNIRHLSKSEICIICHVNPREILFVKCGCICICDDCCSRILLNTKTECKCPTCGQQIQGTYPAFIV